MFSNRIGFPEPPADITRAEVLRGLQLGQRIRQAADRDAALLEAHARTTNSPLVAGVDTFRAGLIRLGGTFLGGTVDRIVPPSEPSTVIHYSDGRPRIIDGGGPGRGALGGQGAAILGAVLARSARVSDVAGQPASGRIAPKRTAVPEGHTRVYRAVSEAEYQDILKHGQLRQGPDSLEGKWFADTLEGARLHGDALNHYSSAHRRIRSNVGWVERTTTQARCVMGWRT